MSETNSFSVLISVYHKEKPDYLMKALNSIWDIQTVKPNQIVIIKDGPLTTELERVLSCFQEKAPLL